MESLGIKNNTKMSSFITDKFILESDLAEKLYNDYAKDLPIIDYHNHLSPKLISQNHKFSDITSIWLEGDHYKWRAMRAVGIEEKYITGDASAFQKFEKWAETVPQTLRNPLYHWTHMELKNPFGIDRLLNKESALEIFEITNDKLATDSFSTQGLLKQFNVEMVGTTDDPTDSLQYHLDIRNNTNFQVAVKPTFRPDKAFNLSGGNSFRKYIAKLGEVSCVVINDIDSLKQALANRICFFDEIGCVASDHGLIHMPLKGKYSLNDINTQFKNVLAGDDSNAKQFEDDYVFELLTFLCCKYEEHDWVQQFHLGPIRNTNTQKLGILGFDTGYDSIGDYKQAERLCLFLNHLESQEKLAKTILYNVNPSDNAVFATMAGNFQGEGIKGKIQFGSAWWFLDQLDGMKDQINALSNFGLISCFIGMLTDSRSFLSYSRHEYFRRLLCNLFAEDVLKGYLPNDEKLIGSMIADICYYNAKNYFK